MKAMVLTEPQAITACPLQVEELPSPVPGPGQICLRVQACGICHTDLHIVEGELPHPRLPLIPGHQIVGIVERLGAQVRQFRPGERVGVPWLYCTCQVCSFCRQGRENLCESAQFTGYHVDGGYAQYVVVAEAFAHRLPEHLSDVEVAPLLCAGVIGYRALRLSGIRPGERLGLYGFGASAHIVIQIARHWGCTVYVFSRQEHHRQLAQALGAEWVGEAQDTPPQTIHSGIIFAPAGWIVLEALRILERGGTLALAGIHMSPIPELDYSRLYQERVIRSVANCTREDVHQLLQLAEQIPIRTQTEVFPLTAANEALQRLKHSQINGAGVLQIAQA